MALKKLFIILLFVQSACAFYNYSVVTINGTTLNMTAEGEHFRQGNWLRGSWLFWMNVIPGEFHYLPLAIVTLLLGFISYVKNRSIVMPAIWFMFMATVVGATVWAGIAPYVGLFALGALITAIIVVFMKNFFG